MGSQKHTPKYLNVGTKNNVKTIFPMSSIILENKGVILYPKPWIAFLKFNSILNTMKNGILIFRYMAPFCSTAGVFDPDKRWTRFSAVK